jgi:CRISPR system Cascade subunit CasD
LDDIAQALREPVRPLFIGRKCCLPGAPLLLEVLETDSLVSVLATMPRAHRADPGRLRAAWWEGEDATATIGESRAVAVSDEREWRSGVHVGRRLVREGHVNPPEAAHA